MMNKGTVWINAVKKVPEVKVGFKVHSPLMYLIVYFFDYHY